MAIFILDNLKKALYQDRKVLLAKKSLQSDQSERNLRIKIST